MDWENFAGNGLWNNGLNWTNYTEGGTGVPPALDVNVQNVRIDPNNGGSCTDSRRSCGSSRYRFD